MKHATNIGEKKKMQIVNKTKAIAIALVLFLTIASLMTSVSTVNAADFPTYAFIVVSPNPVGVGQQALILMWLNLVPPTAAGPSGDRWANMTVTVTKPDGTTQTLGPFKSDDVGSTWTSYVPDAVGTYYFQLSFPGQRVQGMTLFGPVDNYYKSSTSSKVALTVQQEPIQGWPATPLPGPNDYWERPISAENRDWWPIAGNWLGSGRGVFAANNYNYSGRFNPYTKAPNTAHVLWKKPLAFGGLIGGEFGSSGVSNYYTGSAYEPRMTPPVIMNGVLYYDTPDPPIYGFYAVDLRTGETLWWKNSTGSTKPETYTSIAGLAYPGISMGQIYNYISPNQYGGIPYLWGMYSSDTWSLYDAFTGNWILNLANVSTLAGGLFGATIVMSPVGDILVYVLDGFNNWLAMWNSSKAIPTPAQTLLGTEPWLWRPPLGATLDWNKGIQWNVTVPMIFGQAIAKTDGAVIISTNGNLFGPMPGYQTEIAYSAVDGHVQWGPINRTMTPGSTAFGVMGPMQDGVFTEYIKETKQWYGYNVFTGQQIWGPTEARKSDWSMYIKDSFIAYGKFYSMAMDGEMYVYDVKTGKFLWKYFTGSSGLETAYGIWPWFGGYAVADGKIYAGTGHTHLQPLFRGARLHAIDAENGTQLWTIAGWYFNPAIADGILVTPNGYDNQIYAFGKGKTATTVSAPDTVIPQGTSVLIKGTVTDQSPAQKDTPAIADESMSAWMEYLHMQKPIPGNATGVQVTLTALDPNGNTQNIGTVASDMSGTFSSMWTPPVPGKYTIIATFAGSESYWPSYAETSMGVSEAPTATPPETLVLPPTETYILAATVATIIAIAIIGLLMLRKRP